MEILYVSRNFHRFQKLLTSSSRMLEKCEYMVSFTLIDYLGSIFDKYHNGIDDNFSPELVQLNPRNSKVSFV